MISPEAFNKSRILCDTDVVSFIFNGHTYAEYFKPYLTNKTLAISFMSIAEIYYGAYHGNWGTSKLLKLQNHLKNYVVLPYDFSLCLKWADVRKELEKDRYNIGHSDCWIAASALLYDCALATNNSRHYLHVKDLSLISPGLT